MRKLLNREAVSVFLPWGLLALTVLIRFYRLSGGIVLGEPDEVTHQELVDNFHKSFWPTSSGGPWYYELPFYPFLGYLLSFLFPERFLALRIVSVLATGLLVFGIYFYLREKISGGAAFLSALIFSLSPFAVFYSRVGLLDATVVSLAFLSLVFFDLARRRKKLAQAVLAGVFLGGAILAKYAALLFLAVPVSYLLASTLRRSWRELRRDKELKFELWPSLPLITAALLVLPVFLGLYLHDRYLFRLHLFSNLGLLADEWRKQSQFFPITAFFGDLSWWLTWPVMFLSLIGFFLLVWRLKEWLVFLIYFLIVFWAVVLRKPFYPRYLYLLLPFLAIFSGVALGEIGSVLRRKAGRPVGFFIVAVVLATGLPSATEAFRSTRHTLFEGASLAVAKDSSEGGWVFSTYWPNFVSFLVGKKTVGWLSDSPWDSSAFWDSQGRSALEILRQEGGFVLVESLYSGSRDFKNPPSRSAARSRLEAVAKPWRVVVDDSPNFPHFRQSRNEIRIYKLAAGEGGW